MRFILVFAGALTFTHNATSLILPGGANITTAAGDVAWVESLGSGNWKCLVYMPAAGYQAAGSYQPLDAELTALAGLTSAANKVPRFTGSGTAEVIDVAYGTYSATVTAVTNLDAATAPAALTYHRLGNVVTVAGTLSLDPTASGAIEAAVTLPVASNFDSEYDASGTFSITGILGRVKADTTNDRIILIGSSSITVATVVGFTCQYVIK
jgi:hypothetical protein